MHYSKLFRAHKYFLKDPDAYDYYYYDSYMRKIDWSNFGALTNKEIKEVAFQFLNKWGCRSTATDVLASAVKKAYLYHSASISALSSETIQDTDPKSTKEIFVGKFAIEDLIFQIFAGFCNLGNRFRWVATSKLLHMINPNLFIMWDNGIASGYNLKLNERNYAYEFLPKMKEEIDEAILTYMRENECNRASAVSELQTRNKRTLAKLIDEYNFEKHTRGRNDL